VLVLVIIAICAAVAAPTLSGSTRARALPNTATEFITTTRWCRVQALSDGVHYRLNLNVDEGKWSVTKDDGTGINFIPVTNPMASEFKLPEGVSMEPNIKAVDGEVHIDFGPGGRTQVGSVRFIYGDASLEVKCDAPMGSYHLVTGPTR
jgi:Tfp pilus assembly protein FimT